MITPGEKSRWGGKGVLPFEMLGSVQPAMYRPARVMRSVACNFRRRMFVHSDDAILRYVFFFADGWRVFPTGDFQLFSKCRCRRGAPGV
jgi:hypothetical protein